MHVIGSPFIRGPSLKLVLRTPQGDITASGLELYSETVLFFTLPAYPYQAPAGTQVLSTYIVNYLFYYSHHIRLFRSHKK